MSRFLGIGVSVNAFQPFSGNLTSAGACRGLLAASLAIGALLVLLPASRVFGDTTYYWNGNYDTYQSGNFPGNWDYSSVNWEDAGGNPLTYDDSQGTGIDSNVVFGTQSQ